MTNRHTRPGSPTARSIESYAPPGPGATLIRHATDLRGNA